MTRRQLLRFKISSAARRIPNEIQKEPRYKLDEKVPEQGDVVVGRITSVGWHTEMEMATGRNNRLFEGDHVITVLGNRYATSEFEGKVPRSLKRHLEILNAGGISGRYTGKNIWITDPTVFKPLGYLLNEQGTPINISKYALPERDTYKNVPIILVLGSGMDAGKTTTAVSIIQSLTLQGKKVKAGKLTGTSRMKDINLMKDAGAITVIDHVDAGFPSTYRITEEELDHIFKVIYTNLARNCSYIVLEIADGIFQRETNILLRNKSLLERVSHIFFSASDAVAAYGAKDVIENRGLWIDAFSGPVANSNLMIDEVESNTGIRCVRPLMDTLEDIYDIIAD